jgi:hypothetical protein
LDFSGYSDELGAFRLRFVDGENLCQMRCLILSKSADSKSQLVSDGRHLTDFALRAGKTHVMGRSLPENIVWRAKGINPFLRLLSL